MLETIGSRTTTSQPLDLNPTAMFKRIFHLGTIGVLATSAGFVQQVEGQAIFSATSATVNSGGSQVAGSITWTHNQAGLFTPYISDVTNFDTYIAGNPLHSSTFVPNEWFSQTGSGPTAVVTYDFGLTRWFDRFALWNEEFSGIGSLNILGSTDGTSFSVILSGLTPPDHAGVVGSYGATVYSFAATNARFFRMEMSGCPQPDGVGHGGCAIGEVAFRAANVEVGVVPEPSSVALTAAGLIGLGGVAARRRRS